MQCCQLEPKLATAGRVKWQCFIGDAGATQLPQEVTNQCPNREAAGTQRDDGDLQAIKFTHKRAPGPSY